MSADLFAEFSTDSNTDQTRQSNAAANTQSSSTFSFFDDLNSQAPATISPPQPPAFTQNFGSYNSFPGPTSTEDDSDDWGDFEGGSSSTNPAPPAQHDPFAFVSNQQPLPPQQSWTRQDMPSFHPAYTTQSLQESWTKAPIIKAKKPADSSVLFDAEEDVEDDDFGDFEDSQSKPATPAPVAGSSALVDLLGDLDVSQPEPSAKSRVVKTNSKPKAAARVSPAGGMGIASRPKQQTVTPTSTSQADDSWDTFDDWEASIPAQVSKKSETTKSAPTPASSAPAPILSPAMSDVSPGEQPPTNVPPPGVLLSLFPTFFADAQEKLFKPMAAQTLPMRNKLLAEPGTIAYLQGYLLLASVAAHIIAGRKLRWKRDQHLSQGMRIGPASSRATSGMKLTGIDKGENLKEEREASDVVRVWKDQIGRLRHVVSGVNQIKGGTLGAVPDLQETMPVRTLKQSEGGVPARQACMMCGLKRDERVGAADMAVEDSFGEWWIEQVNMHRGCRNFWNEHKDKLRQR
ncbi:hypothetical protein EKO04_010990 [Ascochyta lentis]|uniref:Uncharacterized protein n=1 Tax=Ascochyta lentis TaxID=205686 RepID=A0A8H7IU66_9PLEO|nr:hypothetical protein EKO04_010990 [Ascochyta lentis]